MIEYRFGGLYRENDARSITFTRPETVSELASGQIHIALPDGTVAYPLVEDAFEITSEITQYTGEFLCSLKWIAGTVIECEENFILAIKSRVDGDVEIIASNPDLLEDFETRIQALEAGGGGGGTTNYDLLSNRPQINGNTLTGNKTSSQLGLASALGTDDNYVTDAEKAALHSHSNKSVLDGTTASFTTADETKLDGIAAGAEVNVNADWTATTGDAAILNKPTAGTNISLDGNAISLVDDPSVGGLHFDTATPMVIANAGDIAWNTVDGTLDIRLLNGATLQTGQELHFYGKAVGSISNGDLCQFAGVQGDHILMKKVVASEIKANPHFLIGIATQNIADAAMGYVTWFGKVNGVYTTGWIAGDILYFDNATGQLTKTAPVAPATKIIVASVIKAATGGSENGVLLVRPTFSLNLNELDDVYHNGIQDGYSLIWNGATLRWEAQKKIDTSAYSSAWNGSSYVPTQDAIFDKIETLVPVFYNPATMTVNAGTLNQGTVADLSAVGGTDVIIQELSGANPLTTTFTFSNVARLSSVQMYLDYAGGASHVINCEIYNVGTTAWDILGSFSTTSGKVWRSFQIFNPNSYITAGAVSLRFRHIASGVNTHQLIIDYLDINSGGSGGTGYVGATSVGFTPTGGISATNVQAALAEVDAEKIPVSGGSATSFKRAQYSVDAGSSTTLDCSTYSVFRRSISADTTFTISGLTAQNARMTLVLSSSAVPTFTGATFPASSEAWSDGTWLVVLWNDGATTYATRGKV